MSGRLCTPGPGSGYQMEHLLPSPRSRGESLIQPYPTRSRIGAPCHLHQDYWHPQAVPQLASGLREGCFCRCCLPPVSKKTHLGLEADTALFQCLPRSLWCSSLTWRPLQLLVFSPLGHFSNKGSWTKLELTGILKTSLHLVSSHAST